MDRRERINDSEWSILQVLWEQERGTATEVAHELADLRGWAYSTVKTLLDRMVEKGLVSARRVGNVWEYTPDVAREEATRSAWQKFVDAAFGGATEPALRFIARDARLSRRQRDTLRKLLDPGR